MAILEGHQRVFDISIERRISQAARRETQRRICCIVLFPGIFDVNMPLLHGEGWKAFIRLPEEVSKEKR